MAFTHVVSQGETLAQIAIKFYGTPRFETALVGANALDSHGGSAIVAGQPLEIPAPSHHRVEQNETWAELARIHGLPKLSMGMSHDLEAAIEEGATHIRVGTALFGSRPKA